MSYRCFACSGSGRQPADASGIRFRDCWLCNGSGQVEHIEESLPLPPRPPAPADEDES